MSKYIGSPVVSLSTDTVDVTGDITTTDATPEVIIVNDTHEDTDGGREGKVTFKGQQSGGEETTLAQIQASHDGTSDDEKGDLIFKVNDGSDGASPTERLRIGSDGATTITTEGNEDSLVLKSNDADANAGPKLQFNRNSASAADADLIGEMRYSGRNDASQAVDYARIRSQIGDASDGTEDGQLQIATIVAGTMRRRVDFDPTETVFNDASVDLDFRVESDGNPNALFVDAGNDVVVIGSDVAENRLAQPFAVTSAGARGGMTTNSFFNSSSGPIMDFQVSRNSTAGSHTVVQTDDALGTIIFRGDDGDEFKDAAAIECNVDATPGNDDMSGRLVFFTAPDGSGGLSERMRILGNGVTLVGKSADDNTSSGATFSSGGNGFVRSGAGVASFNRTSSDGTIISIQQAGTTEGTISVSGSTVSYNGGHLARWSQLTDGSKDTSIVKGTVMTNLDKMAVWSHDAVEAQDAVVGDDGNLVSRAVDARDAYTEDNEQLNCMAVSSVEGDSNVAGVFVNWDDDDDEFNDMNVAMTGDMVIRIAKGVTITRGDLLMSAGDGTAKPQGDDIVRSKTIAKVTSTNVSHTYDDESYLVPCVLMAC